MKKTELDNIAHWDGDTVSGFMKNAIEILVHFEILSSCIQSWKYFLLFSSYAQSKATTLDDIRTMLHWYFLYIDSLKDFFPSIKENITAPIYHLPIHLPDFMLLYGSLYETSSSTGERKHQTVRKWTKCINWKNLYYEILSRENLRYTLNWY